MDVAKPGTSSATTPPVLTPVSPIPVTDGVLVQEEESSSTSGQTGMPMVFDLFPDNACYHKLSPSERITLAHKYVDIPDLVESNASKRQKDKNEIVVEEKDKLIHSFPVHTVVSQAFGDYVNCFQKASFKSQTPESSEAAGRDTVQPPVSVQPPKETPASNKFDIKSGFQVSPSIEKWDFKTHNRSIPQVVTFDGDLDHIKSDSNQPNPSTIKLTDGEWGNLQKASSYALRAVSHASWFRDSAFSALDAALPLLDPTLGQNTRCIEMLIDVKQFLIGMDYALEKLAKYSVYPHAGVTSVLRKDFLATESKSMLLEEKSKLFSLPYGDSLVFQSMIHTVAPEVKSYRNESRASQQLEATMKWADSVATKSGKGTSDGNSGNYHNTRSTARGGYQGNNRQASSFYQSRKAGFSPPRNSPKSFPKSTGRGGGANPHHNAPRGGQHKGKGKPKGKKGN